MWMYYNKCISSYHTNLYTFHLKIFLPQIGIKYEIYSSILMIEEFYFIYDNTLTVC
ncbi:conserved hypothetical protein [Brochothrix thermosphacta]|nr:conserved hypothetical protein [Brochothrix thermosphacta]